MRFTKFATSSLVLLATLTSSYADVYEEALRKAAIQNGFLPSAELHDTQPSELVRIGGILFESQDLSLNSEVSCESCHSDQLGSSDGIPNSVGVFSSGHGIERLENSEGRVIPRNSLALWGRGGLGFETFFWDGRVELSEGSIDSQYGEFPPSEDPLVVAVHLPVLELGEMIVEDEVVRQLKAEDTEAANSMHQLIAKNYFSNNEDVALALAAELAKRPEELSFLDAAVAIASFIREKFRIRPTPFEEFVFFGGQLTEQQVRGGLVFYGKGRCSVCHSGPYFSDFHYHAIPFPQIGHGKNGFGVDLGRYNVTFDPSELYHFRTAPLHNVASTSPYGHSGSLTALEDVIEAHFDPLKFLDLQQTDRLDRFDYFRRLAMSSEEVLMIGLLSREDVQDVAAFLHTLSFELDRVP